MDDINEWFHSICNEVDAKPERLTQKIQSLHRQVRVMKNAQAIIDAYNKVVSDERDELIKEIASLLGLSNDERFQHFLC